MSPAPIPFPTGRYSPADRFELTPKGLASLEGTDPEPDPDPEPAPTFGSVLVDGECPTCGALGRVLYGGRRARCEYCAC